MGDGGGTGSKANPTDRICHKDLETPNFDLIMWLEEDQYIRSEKEAIDLTSSSVSTFLNLELSGSIFSLCIWLKSSSSDALLIIIGVIGFNKLKSGVVKKYSLNSGIFDF